MKQLATLASYPAPALVAAAGGHVAYRFLEFFTVRVRNPKTRRAYVEAVGEFCAWLEPQQPAIDHRRQIDLYRRLRKRIGAPPRSSSVLPLSA